MRWYVFMFTGVFIGAVSFIGLWHQSSGAEQSEVIWIERFYQAKTSMMSEHRDEHRLVIVAGSNGLFAFDSERLNAQLEIPVVNYSSAAGLGLRYLIEQVKPELKRGDTVLLPLEYTFYNDTVVPDVTLPLHIISHPLKLAYYSWIEQMAIILHTPFQNVFVPNTDKLNTIRSDLFSVENLTKWGDIKGDTLATFYERYELSQHQYDMATTSSLNERSREILDQFIQWSIRHGVKLIAMPPAIQSHPGLMSAQALQNKSTITQFWVNNGVPFLIPHESIEFDKALMFDSAYHLNEHGRMLFMTKIQHLIAQKIHEMR